MWIAFRAAFGLVLGIVALSLAPAADQPPAAPMATSPPSAGSSGRVSPPVEGAAQESRSLRADRLVPQWELGDRWIVETSSRPLQARSDIAKAAASPAIQWQFSVQRYEKSLEADCFRIEVRPMLGGQQPETVLWVDRQSLALRQIQTQIPTAGGFRTITESYEFVGAQPAPVLGPLSALPIDFPLLTGGEAKAMDAYTYTSYSGPRGTKAVGDLGFTYQVKQTIAAADDREAKSLVDESFAKGLGEEPLVEVRLEGGGREVRQLWQPGRPWPVYCDNGSTICRLVKVMPADSGAGPRQEAHK